MFLVPLEKRHAGRFCHCIWTVIFDFRQRSNVRLVLSSIKYVRKIPLFFISFSPKHPGNFDKAMGRKFNESIIFRFKLFCVIHIILDAQGITSGVLPCAKSHPNINWPSNLKNTKEKIFNKR